MNLFLVFKLFVFMKHLHLYLKREKNQEVEKPSDVNQKEECFLCVHPLNLFLCSSILIPFRSEEERVSRLTDLSGERCSYHGLH